MAQINHDIDIPNSGNGDALRTAFGNQNLMNTELYGTKVDKIDGKGLSSNDYTTTDKNKLDAIEAGAEKNVQPDWNQADDTADDFIKNKPVVVDVETLEVDEIVYHDNRNNKALDMNGQRIVRITQIANTVNPNSAVALDLTGTNNQGVLFPKLTMGEMSNIDEPIPNGLIVEQIDGDEGFYYWKESETTWVKFASNDYWMVAENPDFIKPTGGKSVRVGDDDTSTDIGASSVEVIDSVNYKGIFTPSGLMLQHVVFGTVNVIQNPNQPGTVITVYYPQSGGTMALIRQSVVNGDLVNAPSGDAVYDFVLAQIAASIPNLQAVTGAGGTTTNPIRITGPLAPASTTAMFQVLDFNNVYGLMVVTNTDGTISVYNNGSGGLISNLAFGDLALNKNSGGTFNIAVGRCALFTNTSGSQNSAFGAFSLYMNNGNNNSAFGTSSLLSNLTGQSNTAVGNSTLYYNETGDYNTAIGRRSIFNNKSGSHNIGIGFDVLKALLSGSWNTAIGTEALLLYTGSRCIAIGYRAGYANVSGEFNCLIGYRAGYNVTGGGNTIIGGDAGATITTGAKNTIVGGPTGSLGNVSNNVVLADGDGVIGFRVIAAGDTTVPRQTNALIIADSTGKAVITKEYMAAQISDSGNTVYAGTPTWSGGTAPSGTLTAHFRWTRSGNQISLRVSGLYAVAGNAVSYVDIPWPTGVPAPESIPGFTATGAMLAQGSGGMVMKTPTVPQHLNNTFSYIEKSGTQTIRIYSAVTSGQVDGFNCSFNFFT